MPRLLALAALTLASACGGQDYRWYCGQLNTTPSTWTLRDEYGAHGIFFPLTLRFDGRRSQSCGEGCTCTLSSWTYKTWQGGNTDFGTYQAEGCSAQLTCTRPGVSLAADLLAEDNGVTGTYEETSSGGSFESYLVADARQP